MGFILCQAVAHGPIVHKSLLVAFPAEILAAGLTPQKFGIVVIGLIIMFMHIMAGGAGQFALPVQQQVSWQGDGRLYVHGVRHTQTDFRMAAQTQGFNIGNKKIATAFGGRGWPQMTLVTGNFTQVGIGFQGIQVYYPPGQQPEAEAE